MSKAKTMRRLLALAMALAMLLAFAGCSKEVDPKTAVKDAAIATAEAFGDVNKELGFDAVSELAAGKYGESMGIYLKDANVGTDISGFYGSGFTLDGAADIAGRKVTANIGVQIADYQLAIMDVFLDDSLLGIKSTELLGDTVYAIDTETMAEDFPDAGLEALEGYNVFDLVEQYVGADGKFSLSDETMAALTTAYNTMADASEWTAIDKTSLTSGSDTLECETYTANVPAEAMIAFISDVTEATLNDNYIATIMQANVAAMPGAYDSYESFVADTVATLEEQLAASITEAANLTFYVSDGLLRGVEGFVVVAGVNTDIAIYTGCGKNVADRLELSVTASDGSGELGHVKITSEGNHVPADGKFTDSTVIDINGQGELAWETSYEVGGAYSVTGYLEVQGVTADFSSSGTLAASEDGMDMVIDDLTVSAMGFSVSLDGMYKIFPVDSVEIDSSNVVYMKDLTDEDISAIEQTLNNNAMRIAMELMQEVPALAALMMG